VFRRIALAIGLFVGLVPALARAQTNIDQGKSPAEIFANDCATCHKSARGLAKGRASYELASFLVEHYTASKAQAAELAAYVLGAGGGEPAAAARGPKPAASPEEPKKPPGAIPTVAREPGAATPDHQPATGRQPQPQTASRTRHNEPTAAVTEPAVSGPASPEPHPAPAQSVAVPANTDSVENAPVPRDDIPD